MQVIMYFENYDSDACAIHANGILFLFHLAYWVENSQLQKSSQDEWVSVVSKNNH